MTAAVPAWGLLFLMFLIGMGCFMAFAVVKGLQSQSPGALLVAIPLLAIGGLFLLMLLIGVAWVRTEVSVASSMPAQIAIRQDFENQMRAQETRMVAESSMRAVSTAPVPPPAPAPGTNDLVAMAPVSAAAAIPATDDRSSNDLKSTPPEWVRAGVQRKGEVTTMVYSSKQYATEAEADADVTAALHEYLLGEYHRTNYSTAFGPRQPTSLQHMLPGVIKDRYVETIQRDFGSVFAPMYRVWLKAEITPATYQQFRSQYTAQLQETRLVTAGAGLAGLLCIPLAIVLYGQLNRWTSRRFSSILKTGFSAGVLGLWAVGAFVLARLVTVF